MLVKINKYPNGPTTYRIWCPACDESHIINDTWGYNGDRKKPTFTPSILVTRPANPNASDEFKEYRKEKRCHSFVTDGQWQFLDDSLHDLAGQTVPMVHIPKGLY